MRVAWIAPFWPWPQRTGAHLRVAGLVEGLVDLGVNVRFLGPVVPTPPSIDAGCELVPVLRSGHLSKTRRQNLLHGRPLDTCLPVRSAMSSIDWTDVDVVITTQPFLGPVLAEIPRAIPVVLDAHNVEVDLARTKGDTSAGVRRLVDRLDVARVAAAETAAVAAATTVISPSEQDRARLGGHGVVVPSGAARSWAVRPERIAGPPGALMIGHLGFGPNVDAVEWLAREIEPALHAVLPAMEVTVAGRDPGAAVRRACTSNPRLRLVADPMTVEPLYQRADVALVPLRFGSGTRLKVLEAVRLRIPVVSTSKGVEGLPFRHDRELYVADSVAAFVATIEAVLASPDRTLELVDAAAAMLDDRLSTDRVAAELRAHLDEIIAGVRS